MSISKQVQEKISHIVPGTIFGLGDFCGIGHEQSVSLELSRLSQKGAIERLTKGKYFVPKNSRFGKLRPTEWQILEAVIKENGGYFAGATALNRIGVTTQVPSQVVIRGARSTRKLKIGHLVIQLLKQGNADAAHVKSNLTDVLEAIRLIKKTPDGKPEKTLIKLAEILKALSAEDLDTLVALAKHERPYVRALLGALLEVLVVGKAEILWATLNPLSKYKIGIKEQWLSNKDRWGIA